MKGRAVREEKGRGEQGGLTLIGRGVDGGRDSCPLIRENIFRANIM